MKRIVSVGVDRDTCAAHWCCLVASRVFLDVGELWPVLPENVDAFLDSDRDQIIEAVMACPTAALQVEFEDGKTITSADYDSKSGMEQWRS